MKKTWFPASAAILLAAAAAVRAEPVPYLPFEEDPFKLDYEEAGEFDIYLLLDSARRAVLDEDWPRALYLFDQLNRLDVKNPDYNFAMAQLAFWQSQWTEVLKYISKLPPDYLNLDAALLHAGALLNTGRHGEAEAIFRSLLEADPSSMPVRRGLAEVMMVQHRYDEAVPILEEMLRDDPDVFQTEPGLKEALVSLDKRGPRNRADVLKEYVQKLRIEPVFTPLHSAMVSFLTGNRQRAVEILQEAIQKTPDQPELYHRLGIFYDYLGDKTAADAYITTAVEMAPQSAELHNNRGVLAMYFGRDDQALDSFRRALEIKPDYPEALRNLARIHFFRREWKDAAYAARQALIDDSSSLVTRRIGGYSSFKLKYYEDTLMFLEPLLTDDQRDVRTWFLAAVSAHSLGRRADAERYYRAGLALDPDDVQALNNLADIILNDPSAGPARLKEGLALAERALSLTTGSGRVIRETIEELKLRIGQAGLQP